MEFPRLQDSVFLMHIRILGVHYFMFHNNNSITFYWACVAVVETYIRAYISRCRNQTFFFMHQIPTVFFAQKVHR